MGGERGLQNPDDAVSTDDAEALRLILTLAEALREEFGVGIDAHPGGEGSEAGVVNRALRAAARCILRHRHASSDGPTPGFASILREAARRRLIESMTAEGEARRVSRAESGFGDAWPAYLLLVPPSVIEEILDSRSR